MELLYEGNVLTNKNPSSSTFARRQIPDMPKHFAKYTSKWPVGSPYKCFGILKVWVEKQLALKQPDGTIKLYKLQQSDLVASSASLAAQTTSLT